MVVAALILTLPIGRASSAARVEASVWSNVMDGVRYVRSERTIALLVLLAAVPALFILNYLVLMPVFARDILAIGAPGLGLLNASLGVGALSGALLVAGVPAGRRQRAAAAHRPRTRRRRGLIVFGLSTWVPLSCVALAILGGSQVAYYATTNTLIQVLVAPRLRGRVLSLYILTSIGVIPFGNLVAGRDRRAVRRGPGARRRRVRDAHHPRARRDRLPGAPPRPPGARDRSLIVAPETFLDVGRSQVGRERERTPATTDGDRTRANPHDPRTKHRRGGRRRVPHRRCRVRRGIARRDRATASPDATIDATRDGRADRDRRADRDGGADRDGRADGRRRGDDDADADGDAPSRPTTTAATGRRRRRRRRPDATSSPDATDDHGDD